MGPFSRKYLEDGRRIATGTKKRSRSSSAGEETSEGEKKKSPALPGEEGKGPRCLQRRTDSPQGRKVALEKETLIVIEGAGWKSSIAGAEDARRGEKDVLSAGQPCLCSLKGGKEQIVFNGKKKNDSLT